MSELQSDYSRFSIPSEIKEFIKDKKFTIDDIGKSGAQILCFDNMVLKMQKPGEEAGNERRMLEWLEGRLPVPRRIAFQRTETMDYLLMSRMDGDMACADSMLDMPEVLAGILAEGLKQLWSVDISRCPYVNNLDNKLRLAGLRVKNGLCDMEDAEKGTYGPGGFNGPHELLEWLILHKPDEQLVFSHGDYCLPNIFVKDGHIRGFIDLGRSGAADMYQDIALCLRSLKSNFGGVYNGRRRGDFNENMLFEALGIIPDWDKIRYYILLDELF